MTARPCTSATVAVPVSHEEVVVERRAIAAVRSVEPITEEETMLAGALLAVRKSRAEVVRALETVTVPVTREDFVVHKDGVREDRVDVSTHSVPLEARELPEMLRRRPGTNGQSRPGLLAGLGPRSAPGTACR